MDTNPVFPTAANAVRHGLAGARHVPKEAVEALKAIEADLIALKQPADPEDFEILRDMAQAIWQVGEHQRREVEHLEMQIARGSDIFDQKAQESFRTLLADWQADPAAHAQAMSQNYLGTKHFAQVWKAVAESLGSDGAGLSLKMTCQAVLAEGVSPAPDEIYGDGAWIMKRFLASTESPSETVKEWTSRFGMQTSKTTVDRAERLYLSAPDTAVSINELHVRAQEKYQYWDNLMQKRRGDYDLAKIQFTQANAGNGMGDKEMETQVRLMHRYKVAAQNRVDKLDRKLKINQSERRKREQKHYLWEQREKERKENRDLKISKLNKREFEQYQEHLDQEDRRETRHYYEQQQMAAQQYREVDEEPTVEDPPKPPAVEPTQMQSGQRMMKVQSVVEENHKKPAEIPVAITPEPEPQALDEEWLELLEGLMQQAFATEPHVKMFTDWPDEYFTKQGMHAVRRSFQKHCPSEAVGKEIYKHLILEFGHRNITQMMEARMAADSAALKQMAQSLAQQPQKKSGK
jgi:hypothetical protein